MEPHAFFGDSTQLLYLRSRMYAPLTGRFTTKDSWQGDYNEPLSFNRWSYVIANPVNFTDPSGHCSGDRYDPNNPDIKCWKLIDALENTYDNVSILDQETWTYEELYLLRYSIEGHAFSKDILSAKELNFYRREFGGIGVGGHTIDPLYTGEWDITIFNPAYDVAPNVNTLGADRLANFQGTLVHELTHVATGQNPLILISYREEEAKHFWPSPIGGGYDKSICNGKPDCLDLEMIAITAATWQVDRNSFHPVTHTNWRNDWISSQISISPLLGVCYGPLP